MKCDQCQMLSINGVACHETGCPNMNARWDTESETWVKQRKCFDCGCTVDADDPCCWDSLEADPETALDDQDPDMGDCGSDFDDEEDDICDTTDCTNSLADGEGFDGYCGNCADKRENERENRKRMR